MPTSPVKSIQFENYRAFKAKQTIELQPLTLLFGYNNSGKSAAVRFLPFLASSFNASRRQAYTKSHLNYSAGCIRGATFKDISYANGDKIGLGIDWTDGTSLSCELRQAGADPETFSSLDIAVFGDDGPLLQQKFVQSAVSGLPGETLYETADDSRTLLAADGFVFKPRDATMIGAYQKLRELQQDVAESVHWLASVRVHPPREFEVGAGIEIGVKPNGEGTAQTLWHLAESGHQSFKQINEWLEKTCGRRIDISTATSTAKSNGRRNVKLETVSAKTEALHSGSIRVPILDSGEGIAQALPVVTLCAQAAHGYLGDNPVVVIEQPELHLHPKATVDLANFIIDCINLNKRARFVIETHSESLLLAMQTALVEGLLKPNEVSCYWVRPTAASGSTLTPISFDNEGFVSDDWPDEVFAETLAQARTLIEKRNEKINKPIPKS